MIHLLTVLSATGRELQCQSVADLVPGAQVLVSLSIPGQTPCEVLVEVRKCESSGELRTYTLQILTQALPRWLSRQLNLRSAFRVDTTPEEPIPVTLLVGERRWSGQLIDASQEGIGMLCNEPISKLSRVGSAAAISVTLPEGECQFSIQIRYIISVGGKCQLGMSIQDDGSLEYRKHRRMLTDYVMRRQREQVRERMG